METLDPLALPPLRPLLTRPGQAAAPFRPSIRWTGECRTALAERHAVRLQEARGHCLQRPYLSAWPGAGHGRAGRAPHRATRALRRGDIGCNHAAARSAQVSSCLSGVAACTQQRHELLEGCRGAAAGCCRDLGACCDGHTRQHSRRPQGERGHGQSEIMGTGRGRGRPATNNAGSRRHAKASGLAARQRQPVRRWEV